MHTCDIRFYIAPDLDLKPPIPFLAGALAASGIRSGESIPMPVIGEDFPDSRLLAAP